MGILRLELALVCLLLFGVVAALERFCKVAVRIADSLSLLPMGLVDRSADVVERER